MDKSSRWLASVNMASGCIREAAASNRFKFHYQGDVKLASSTLTMLCVRVCATLDCSAPSPQEVQTCFQHAATLLPLEAPENPPNISQEASLRTLAHYPGTVHGGGIGRRPVDTTS
eukprot:8168069-Pyramimonas_sp.AAC.2